MCTTGAVKINGSFVLFKNRDPVKPMEANDKPNIFEGRVRRLLVSNDEGSYSGLNEHGVGIVCSFVKLLEGDDVEQARTFLNVLPELLDSKILKETIDKLKRLDKRFTANYVLADEKECFFLEYAPDKKEIRQVGDRVVRTNHFSCNPIEKRTPESFPWNFKRYDRANELIKRVKTIEDIKKLLSDHQDYPEYSICNHGSFAPTGSSYILDLKNRKILHCLGTPCKNEYKEYGLK